jgi:hypothetical protein
LDPELLTLPELRKRNYSLPYELSVNVIKEYRIVSVYMLYGILTNVFRIQCVQEEFEDTKIEGVPLPENLSTPPILVGFVLLGR